MECLALRKMSILTSVVALLLCSQNIFADNGLSEKKSSNYVPKKIIVKYKAEGAFAVKKNVEQLLVNNEMFVTAVEDKSSSLDELNHHFGVISAKQLFPSQALGKSTSVQQFSKINKQVEEHTSPLSNVYVLELSEEQDIEEACLLYAQDSHVEYAQPDYLVTLDLTPNDPKYLDGSLWGLQKIKANQAWDITQGSGIIVAVNDTGVNYNHVDIAANIWSNPGEIAGNGIDDDGNGYIDDVRGWDFANNDNAPLDTHGHGTHVAGTVAAVGNNNIGVIGVAPQATVMPLKGFADNTDEAQASSLAEGIIYAANNGADIINNSWGCGDECPQNPVVEDAVRFAHNLGAVVVFSAGNSQTDVLLYSPVNMAETIGVASTDINDTESFFSNHGYKVDVSAPGSNIISLGLVNDTYEINSGTSMSAPHVSGLAALILSNRPGFSNEEVKHIIRSSAEDVLAVGRDDDTGYGRIDAEKALSFDSALNVKISDSLYGAAIYPSDESFVIQGTVAGNNFAFYDIYYYPIGNPLAKQEIRKNIGTPVNDGILATFSEVGSLQAGAYLLEVEAYTTEGLVFRDSVPFSKENFDHVEILSAKDTHGTIDIFNGNIVYDDVVGVNREIFLFNINSKIQRRITTDVARQYLPQIDGDKIVWVDERHANRSEVYMYDLTTNQEQRISNSAGNVRSLSISGDHIVWVKTDSSLGSGAGDVYLYKISQGQEVALTNDAANQIEVDISGDNVIWMQYVSSDDFVQDLFYYNITTQQVQQVVFGTASLFHKPRISGDKIVWQDVRGNVGHEIFLFDLASQQEKKIAASQSGIEQLNPTISGNKIVWNTGVFKNHGDTNIFIYDIPSQQTETVTFNSGPQNFPVISEDVIVWRDGREIPFGLYYTFLEPYQAPAFETINPQSVVEGESLTFTVTASGSGNLTLSADLPSGQPLSTIGATFTDNGDNTGTFQWNNVSSIFNTQGIIFLAGDSRDSLAIEFVTIDVYKKGKLIAPVAGQIILPPNLFLEWTPGNGVEEYFLHIGTTGIGSKNIYNSSLGQNTSVDISGIPLTGANNLHVRLFSKIQGRWYSDPYVFTVEQQIEEEKAELILPSAGSILNTETINLEWTAGKGVQEYYVYVGTQGVGSKNLHNQAHSNLNASVSNIELNGKPIYVLLWSRLSTGWEFNDYVYQTENQIPEGKAAELISPIAGTVLSSSPVTFEWTEGEGVAQYYLYVGTQGVGSKNLYNQAHSNLSASVSNIPFDGKPVYVRMWSRINTGWVAKDYVYQTENQSIPDELAELILPTEGTVLSSPSVTFEWTEGVGVDRYWLYVGTGGVGTYNVHNGEKSGTSAVISNIPINGAPIYVRLWSHQVTGWKIKDYVFQTVNE